MTGRAVTIGESMGLLSATSVGSLAQVPECRVGIGGAESNVAIAMSRLGAAVTWVGRVGADSLGDRVLRELRAEGVDVRAVRDPDAATGLMLKEHRTAEATRVFYYRSGSAGSRLSEDDVQRAEISSASLLHLTGITPALSSSAAEAVLLALDQAEAAGVSVSFDVNHRQSLWGGRDAGAAYRRIAERSATVFAGVDEARLLIPGARSAGDLASGISELGPTAVVIKLGPAGCLALVDGDVVMQPAVPIAPIDTVGAGDAFVGGYLAEQLLGRDTETRLRTAVTAGAFACLHPGDWEGYPRRNELELLEASEPVTR